MNKEAALQWLMENFFRWPESMAEAKSLKPFPIGWDWMEVFDDNLDKGPTLVPFFISSGATFGTIESQYRIHRDEWELRQENP